MTIVYKILGAMLAIVGVLYVLVVVAGGVFIDALLGVE